MAAVDHRCICGACFGCRRVAVALLREEALRLRIGGLRERCEESRRASLWRSKARRLWPIRVAIPLAATVP